MPGDERADGYVGQVVIFEVVDGRLANSSHIPCGLYARDDVIG
jgi:hypothetical protein